MITLVIARTIIILAGFLFLLGEFAGVITIPATVGTILGIGAVLHLDSIANDIAKIRKTLEETSKPQQP